MKEHRVTVRLSADLHRRLEAAARRSKRRSSDLVREAVERHLHEEHTPSAYELFEQAGLIGIVKGAPPDLSANKEHFEGFGES